MNVSDKPNQRSRQNRQIGAHRKGIFAVLTAVLLIPIFAFVALAIDTGLIVLAKTEMQKAVDLAALSGIPQLYDADGEPTVTAARNSALQLVARNTANTVAPVVLQADDVVIGIFDVVTRTVTPNLDAPDAIEVTAYRTRARGTGLDLAFAPIIGIQEADVTTSSVAYLPDVSTADIIPMALRAPDFGPVDPEIAQVNPGKDGPSFPLDGESFDIGEQVTVFTYGKGKKSPIHLTLNIDSPGPGAAEADVKKVLRGDEPPVQISLGDEYYVFNEGSGSGGYGSAIDDRIDTLFDDSLRDVILPVVDVIPGESRVYQNNGLGWELAGRVRVVDFVSVHLEDAIEVTVPDPQKPGATIDIRLLVGTVTKRMVSDGGGGAEPSGSGGRSVIGYPKLVR